MGESCMRGRQDGVVEHQTQSGRMAPSNAESERKVDPRRALHPDSRFTFQHHVRQTHGTHGTQGITFF